MITVQDISHLMEAFAPLAFQESYDNAGLILGDPKRQVEGIMICLDVTEPVIDEAIQTGCNLIISHHPLIFSPLKKITGLGHVEGCLVKAIQHQIALYACHTNADAMLEGVNSKMAQRLGIINTSILSPSSSCSDANRHGMGIIGDLTAEMNEWDFLFLVKQQFGSTCLRYSALRGLTIKRVAVCGGAGSSLLNEAAQAGAQALVTGEASFHEFFTEGLPLILIDAGHFETEQFTKELFYELISKNFPTFAVQISKAEKNPVNYL
jgi:dinuclear metal center YbgI/SA1388 family protein